MAEQKTIYFLPEKINRQPIIYRGFTNDELLFGVAISSVLGAIIGLIIAVVTGFWLIIPLNLLFFVFLYIRFGGKYITRMKRGKPETWLVRYFEYQKHRKLFKNPKIVDFDAVWAVRRERKTIKRTYNE